MYVFKFSMNESINNRHSIAILIWDPVHRYQTMSTNGDVSKGDIVKIVRIAHDDVIKWKHFPLYWPFVMASDAELWCLLWFVPE